MSSNFKLPFVERPEFFTGQRLFANDFNAMGAFDREMRWLHNRSLHTWGIGSGFQVTGEIGDREVIISPGYALDKQGREIVLLADYREAIPPVAGDNGEAAKYYLTVHYRPDEDLEETETRRVVCQPADVRGTIRRREEPVFCWIKLDPGTNLPLKLKHRQQIAEGEKIVLAKIAVKNCQIELPLILLQRRSVRPAPTPYIACGKTPETDTTWEKWKVPSGLDMVTIGIKTTVDTSAARFSRTPCYSARVAGNRYFTYSENNETHHFLLDGFPQIHNTVSETQSEEEVGPNHFVLKVLMPQFSFCAADPCPTPPPSGSTPGNIMVNPTDILDHDNFLNEILTNKGEWHVVWMGVEE